jgi:sugar phosphate isomerase/epimerase
MSRHTRREFVKMAAAAVPVASALLYPLDLLGEAKPNSKIHGVQIGVISYSFMGLTAADIIPAMLKIGLSEVELMSNHAESLAGAPMVNLGFGGFGPSASGPQTLNADGLLPRCANMQMASPMGGGGRGRGPLTPEQQAAQDNLMKWREAATPETWAPVRKMFADAGIDLHVLCYNMNVSITDAEIDYAFRTAKALGVKAISSSSTVTVAKRVAPVADKYQIMWGGHGHDDINDPEQFATPETFQKIMSFGKYIGVNLDIGHFTAAGFDAVAFIKENHDHITNIHLKDRKRSKDFGVARTSVALNNYPWGQGDTPIKEVLKLMEAEKYPFPANIEYEYGCRTTGDAVTEVAKCYEYAKAALA